MIFPEIFQEQNCTKALEIYSFNMITCYRDIIVEICDGPIL